MKQRNNQDAVTVAKRDGMGQSDQTSSYRGSSLSPRRPQEFYYDIEVTPRTEKEMLSPQSKKVKNRLKAFELASRALRDVPVDYDPLGIFSGHRSSDHPRDSPAWTASDHQTRAKISEDMLDFGNNSDSRVIRMRREALRRKTMSKCDPSWAWGELTHHRSANTCSPEPKIPPTYYRNSTRS